MRRSDNRLLLVSATIFLISSLLTLISSHLLGDVSAKLALPTEIGRNSQSATAGPSQGKGGTATSTPMTPTATLPAEITEPVSHITVARDTFKRPDQLHWGSMDDNTIDWDGEGTTGPAFSVRDHHGIITGDGEAHDTYYDILQVINAEALVTGSISKLPGNRFGLLQRRKSPDTWYGAYIDGNQLVLEKSVGGQHTQLANYPFQAQAQVEYSLRFRCLETVLAVKVWPKESAEPAQWQIVATDASIHVGYSGMYAKANKGAEVNISFYIGDMIFH